MFRHFGAIFVPPHAWSGIAFGNTQDEDLVAKAISEREVRGGNDDGTLRLFRFFFAGTIRKSHEVQISLGNPRRRSRKLAYFGIALLSAALTILPR